MEEIKEENIPLTETEAVSKPCCGVCDKKSCWKWAFLVALLFLAVSFVYAGYQFSQKATPLPLPTPTPMVQPSPTPTPNPTANWKTYMGQRYIFGLKYPSDWTIKTEFFPDFNNEERITFQPASQTPTNFTEIVLSAESNKYNSTVSDFVENYTVADIRGFRKSLPGGQNPPQELAYFSKGNVYISAQLVYMDKSFVKLFDQILSTFKFLE